MSKQNDSFAGKVALDCRVEKYADYVYATFEQDRIQGKVKSFGGYYYPAMVSVCTDALQRFNTEGYADSPDAAEYAKTSLLGTMENDFNGGGNIKSKDTFKKISLCIHPLGQCAEQHAANELLQVKGAENLDIKQEVFFSKAIRPATLKDYPPCANCQKLFDL